MADVPGTDWQETIAPDEAQRYEDAARRFAAIQQRKSKTFGTGRTLHRKQLTAAYGTLEVLDSLPAWAAQGLFSRAARLRSVGAPVQRRF
jgi:hypothetical protein